MNKEWHEKNKMPKNADESERLKWHIKHQKNCACRPIPKSLAALVKKTKTKKA